MPTTLKLFIADAAVILVVVALLFVVINTDSVREALITAPGVTRSLLAALAGVLIGSSLSYAHRAIHRAEIEERSRWLVRGR